MIVDLSSGFFFLIYQLNVLILVVLLIEEGMSVFFFLSYFLSIFFFSNSLVECFNFGCFSYWRADVCFLWVDLEVFERAKVVINCLHKENMQLQEEIKAMKECRFHAGIIQRNELKKNEEWSWS